MTNSINRDASNNSPVELRPLGNTGIQVTPLCYGCAAAYARDLISDEMATELFKMAYDLGIRFFDTAINYGKAEDRIGLSLKKYSIDRNKIVISTKGGKKLVDNKFYQDINPKSIKENVDVSLKRMGIDYIDILYLHGPCVQDLREDVLECFDELKKAGKIRASGANTFDDTVINYIIQTKCLDVVMLDYNIVKQNREPQIKALYENGTGVIAGQALAESLFTSDLFKIREKKDIWYLARTFGRKSSRQLFFEARKFLFLNKLKTYDGSQIALKYVIDNPYISGASFGTCSFEHLQKDVGSMDIIIPEEIKEKIKRAAAK